MGEESDPTAVTNALAAAIDAFNEEGHGIPTREEPIDSEADWKTQLTKACRLLAAVEHIAGQGFYTTNRTDSYARGSQYSPKDSLQLYGIRRA